MKRSKTTMEVDSPPRQELLRSNAFEHEIRQMTDEEAELEARLRAEAALDDRDDEERGGRIDPATGRVRPRALEVDEEDDEMVGGVGKGGSVRCG